jgi:methylated-DNA-[protein]-cysteine S-methyltransferase
MMLEVADCTSPIGRITLAAHDGRLCALDFTERWPGRRAALVRRFGAVELRRVADPAGAVSALAAYFAGNLGALDGVAVDPGGTPFQRRVWTALRRVPPGRSVSYGELAREIGAPDAARAVGAGNGANPVALVIPCHRAIRGDGGLGGYAAGVHRKRWLLAHEGAGRTAA